MAQDWLREPAKAHAKEALVTGKCAWGTVITWATALKDLSEFLSEEGIDDPLDLDRSIYLDYIACLDEAGASKHKMAGSNTAASLLGALHDRSVDAARRNEVDGQIFGSEVFLRHGENAVGKTRAPKPCPEDVIRRVDTQVLAVPNYIRPRATCSS